MKLKNFFKIIVGSLVVFSIFFTNAFALAAPSTTNEKPQELVLGLYPYVPRFEQFQESIQEKWQKIEPKVALKVLSPEEWDGGYDLDPPDYADVYVFDALFLNYFKSKGFLLPLESPEVEHQEDFLNYAKVGVQLNGNFYAIPQLGCTNMLFYRQQDTALKNAKNLTDIYQAVGQCSYTSKIPPDSRGLMIDMAGGITNACLYMDAFASVTNQFPVAQPIHQQQVNPQAISNLQMLLKMGSYYNATQQQSYEAASWFSNGYGRAVVGFTESMSEMNPNTLEKIDFKVLPLADGDEKSLFYADVIGIHPNAEKRGHRTLAVKLANLLASSENMIDSLDGKDFGQPQYLMPTRQSVFARLAQSYPAYQKMYQVVTTANPILFTLDADAKNWLSGMKGILRNMVRENYACGCDLDAGVIWNQQDANSKCPRICAKNGGWSGQWVTTVVGQSSACSCNTCSVSTPIALED